MNYKRRNKMIIKRIEELETTQDGVKRFIEDYITGSFIDIEPLGENEEIIDIKIVPGKMVKILILIGDK
jgi:hypothetical protein